MRFVADAIEGNRDVTRASPTFGNGRWQQITLNEFIVFGGEGTPSRLQR